jgi:hypothetical protein
LDRQAALSSLIHFDAPVAELKVALASLSWDADPAVTLTRQDVLAVLYRFASCEVDADSLEA